MNDPAVARKYLQYWEKLSADPKKKGEGKGEEEGITNWTVRQQPDLKGAPRPNSITTVFSPRLTKGMLDWFDFSLRGTNDGQRFLEQ